MANETYWKRRKRAKDSEVIESGRFSKPRAYRATSREARRTPGVEGPRTRADLQEFIALIPNRLETEARGFTFFDNSFVTGQKPVDGDPDVLLDGAPLDEAENSDATRAIKTAIGNVTITDDSIQPPFLFFMSCSVLYFVLLGP